MKIGDKVKMSNKNLNHLGYDVCAYAGMEGVVSDVYDDGSFVIDCGNSTLVVPMNNSLKQPNEGVFIWLNDRLIFHKRIDTRQKRNPKKWFKCLCHKI